MGRDRTFYGRAAPLVVVVVVVASVVTLAVKAIEVRHAIGIVGCLGGSVCRSDICYDDGIPSMTPQAPRDYLTRLCMRCALEIYSTSCMWISGATTKAPRPLGTKIWPSYPIFPICSTSIWISPERPMRG